MLNVTLGEYPEMGLREAREKRDQYNVTIKPTKMAQNGPTRTFKEVAEDYMRVICNPASMTSKNIAKNRSRLTRLIYPSISEKLVNEITSQDILPLLQHIEDKGYSSLARDVKQLISRILKHGVSCGWCNDDVTRYLGEHLKAVVVKHRATLKSEEVPGFLKCAFGAAFKEKESLVNYALIFHIYTFVRPGELRIAEWDEFDFQKKQWIIPAEKMKCNRPHIMPLSDQALKIIELIKDFAIKRTSYLFYSNRAYNRPISDMTENALIRSVGCDGTKLCTHRVRA